MSLRYFVPFVLLLAISLVVRIYYPAKEITNPEWDLIQVFHEISEKIQMGNNWHVGVGYNACIDININFSEFKTIYDSMFNEDSIQPKSHKEIYTHKQFIETFLHFFKEGASAERIAVNQTLVHEIVNFMDKMNLKHYKEVGGHATKFSQRIAKENCTAFFPSKFTEFAQNSLKSNNIPFHD